MPTLGGGAHARPSGALLVNDLQLGLIDGFEDDWSVALPRTRDLVAAARAAGAAVFWIQHSGSSAGHPLRRAAAGGALHHSLDARAEDPRVDSRWSDVFQDTDLHEQLQARPVTRVIITGSQTDFCIDATVRHGAPLGYDINLVPDAHTTSDNRLLTRQQIMGHHDHTLRHLAVVGTTVRTSGAATVTFG
jgi:nicotinamidase-related amidase